MDHEILVAEMSHIEKLPTQDRLKLARQRRADQLRRWFDKEKRYTAGRERGKRDKAPAPENDKTVNGVTSKSRQIQFVPCVILLEAAARNDIAEVRRLLSAGVDPDSTNDDELTALHQCCIDDSEEMMKLLLEFGANVNAEDCEKWTPLHAAATCGHLHLVKYLVAKGANLLAVNADGNMPYDICEDDTTLAYIESEMAKRGVTQELIDETRSATEEQMLKELRDHAKSGGDLEGRDSHGATPLHISAANGYMKAAAYLLEEHHVSTEVIDEDEWQPIHAAACWGHIDVLELLVENGADLNARTRNGETPFDLCEDIEMKERIIQLRTEQETKRIQKRHVMRRMSSNRHRTNSVKRVSIKEKQQTSWKEAKQEADLRKQFEQQLQPKIRSLQPIDQSLDLDDINLEVCPVKEPKPPEDVGGMEDHRSNNIVALLDERNRQNHNNNNIHNVNGNPNVQMDIHVTVTVNATPGTLPDLKKHRARSRPPSQNSLVLSASNLTVATNGSSQSLNKLNESICYDSPPSPTISPKKFISDPSEVVGPSGKFRCCAVM